MKILLISIILIISFGLPRTSLASQSELDPCIELAHCSREEWDVISLQKPFESLKDIVENTPRTKIIELEDNYIHAEVTSRWMKYVDDLEIAYLPDKNNIQIRSESRVGESDLGVNSKRVGLLKTKLFKNNF